MAERDNMDIAFGRNEALEDRIEALKKCDPVEVLGAILGLEGVIHIQESLIHKLNGTGDNEFGS